MLIYRNYFILILAGWCTFKEFVPDIKFIEIKLSKVYKKLIFFPAGLFWNSVILLKNNYFIVILDYFKYFFYKF